MLTMGSCMSTSSEESEQKKRSQAIDKTLEEDSKRLRKECKILLLGMVTNLILALTDMPNITEASIVTCLAR